jgi:hypothetical protein
MSQITTQIRIQGQPTAIFDLLTTARLWPHWHPATTGVGGVIERPYQLGDVVRERARIGARTHEGVWTVAEHDRPNHVLLQMQGDRLRIHYALAPDGDGVWLTRQLWFFPEDFAGGLANPAGVEQLMATQSAQALDRLRALIEHILAQEATQSISNPPLTERVSPTM